MCTKNNFILKFILVWLVFVGCKNDVQTIEKEQVIEITFEKEGEAELYIGDSVLKKLDIEFALTANQRSQGLMYRSKLEENQGMLFIHPDNDINKHSYWMKNTRIPLDIIFIAPDSTVINIAKNNQPMQEQVFATAEEDAKFVLEIAGGLSDSFGIEPKKTKLRWTATQEN